MYDIDSYIAAFYALLPPGTLFSTDKNSVAYRVVASIAEEFVNIDRSAYGLVVESNPLTMSQMTMARYGEAGIGKQNGYLEITSDDKKQAVLGRWRARGGASKAYFLEVLGALGVAASIIDLHDTNPPMLCNGLCTSPVNDKYSWGMTWQINYVDSSVKKFKAGLSTAGDPLGTVSNNTAFIDYIERVKPAHTHVIYNAVPSL
jgi:uncharacterized protein YmfQ (DUF2313 family)